MNTLIENFINGNLALAKEQAREFTGRQIFLYLRLSLGYSWNKASAIAVYLKHPSQATFDAACQVT